jgi:RNA polymerase subunit RPABC4/transcription elongation factor Spt4
MVDMFWKIVNF